MCLSTFALCSVFSGAHSILTGNTQYLRGVLKTYGDAVIIYGGVSITLGDEKFVCKVAGAN